MKNIYKLAGVSIITFLAIFSLSETLANAQIFTSVPSAPEPCHVFNFDLKVGDRGDDVDALVAFLVKKGYISNPLNEPIRGEDFNETVAQAVKDYQASIGLPATSYVGPLTRSAMNAECGPTIPTPTNPSIIVLSPNNGTEKFAIDDIIQVAYAGTNLSDTLKVYLYSPIYGNVAEATGLYGYPLGTGKGTINIGQNKNTRYYTGQFKVTICDEKNSMPPVSGKPLCDTSDNYFTISSSTPVSTASVQVTSSKLDLSYDGVLKEGLLTSQFDVSINGGARGVYVYKESVGVQYIDQNSKYVTGGSRTVTPLVPQSVVSSVIDQNGTTLFVIPAGQTIKFKMTSTTDPKQMFAGTYYAVLEAVVANASLNTNSSFYIYPPANKTNTKTIVGEKSPYITSVTNPAKPGNTMTVQGERLNSTTISIDGVIQRVSAKVTRDGKTLTFTLPKLANGQHFLTLKNKDGLSNKVYFEVGSVQVGSSANVVPGKLVLRYDANRNEAFLIAPFTVTVTAGSNDIRFEEGSFAVSYLGKGVQQNVTTKIESIKGSSVSVPFTPYILKAGQKAEFSIGASADPLKMFAGYYTFSLTGIFASRDNGREKESESFVINVNNTNSVVIVGEKSPYINFVTSPIKSGEKLMLEGARLNASDTVYVDGVVLTGITPDTSKDFRTFWFVLPSLSNGQHIISLYNKVNGASNTLRFDVEGRSTQSSIKVLRPNGGETIQKGSLYRIKWDSTNVDQVYIKLRKGADTYYGNEQEISRPISNENYFDWRVPTTIPDGNDYGITLVKEGGNVFDISDRNFTISSPIATQSSISVLTRIGTRVLSSTDPCVSSLVLPSGNGNTGGCTRTIANQTPGTYSVRWNEGYPAGADTTKQPTITPAQTLGSSSITFYIDFAATPTVALVTVLPWTAPSTAQAGSNFNYTLNWTGGPVGDPNYMIFVHFKNRTTGQVVVGGDFYPAIPVSSWSGSITTPNTTMIPANAPLGTYDVIVGIYRGADTVPLVAGSGVTSINSINTGFKVGTLTVTKNISEARALSSAASVLDSIGGFFNRLYGFDGN